MFQYRQFNVPRHNLGLLYRDSQFVRTLLPGTYWFCDPMGELTVETAHCWDGLVRASGRKAAPGQSRKPRRARSRRSTSLDSAVSDAV